MKKIKRGLASFLIVLMVVVSSAPRFIFAQEGVETPQEPPQTQTTELTPEPEIATEETPTPEGDGTGIENQAVVEDDISSEAVTGENTIEISPTPTPAMCVEETQENIEEGTEPSSEPSQEATPSTSIETSDSISLTQVENSVNTTEVNSQAFFHTLNIYVYDVNNIDLTSLPMKIAEAVFGEDERNDEVVNVQILNAENFAYLSNEIVSTADTGNNSIEGGGGTIKTGDAYSIVSLLNKVNTTIVDSNIHFVTINIFGNVGGNIILPEVAPGDVRACCSSVGSIQNTAEVGNVVNSSAISGQNALITAGEGESEIQTGEASSVVNVLNIVNTNLINVVFRGLYINTLGSWVGDFLGWFGSQEFLGGINSSPLGEGGDCEGCRTDDVNITNSAYVSNNVLSLANTGGNKLQGESGSITTGNAYSSVNIINLVNSSIIGSWGYFAFINIFGTLTGDIGGESEFPTPEPVQANSESQPFTRETGGVLEVTHHHNVGNWVYPGDTVTFFADIKNPGTGIVYDTTLYIELFRQGVPAGGAFFNIGEIKAHKSKKLTTGLVLSENAKPGLYEARVSVVGLVGPGDTEISSDSYSSFEVAAFTPLVLGGVDNANAAANPVTPTEVLGTVAPVGANIEQRLLLLFLLLSSVYLAGRGYQNRRRIVAFVYNNKKYFGPAAVALRGILLKVGPMLSVLLSFGKHR